jgi:hypothetical protein
MLYIEEIIGCSVLGKKKVRASLLCFQVAIQTLLEFERKYNGENVEKNIYYVYVECIGEY